jgi:TRAP-type transport system periplasmic protein
VASLESLVSVRLFEQAPWLTVPGHNALCFMYEPVVVSKRVFDRLDDAQRHELRAAGRKTGAAFETEAADNDQRALAVLQAAGVNISGMTPADYYAWLAAARRSAYASVACNILGGDELISKALSVG